ncbi:dCMP deaminase family protein [Candidatus Pacearchaeota archaeon]|nr:dCMP deaminase family protein [Candidatus Pacearchaeota archaeon]
MNEWDIRFMKLAKHIGQWSKDRSRKVGCVIVGLHDEIRSTGFNGFPRNANDQAEHRHKRPVKYKWTEHAERNAIYNASRIGVPLIGCRMYVPWFPCMECARAIVQVGIEELICFEPDLSDPTWGEDFKTVLELFSEAKVSWRYIDV